MGMMGRMLMSMVQNTEMGKVMEWERTKEISFFFFASE